MTGTSRKKILIVEDDRQISKVYQNFLSDYGYSIYVAYDGDEGLAKAREIEPDIILLDIVLPPGSGLDMLRKLKSDTKTSLAKVIILSNLKDNKTLEEALELGVRTYIVKVDHSLEELLKKIKDQLED